VGNSDAAGVSMVGLSTSDTGILIEHKRSSCGSCTLAQWVVKARVELEMISSADPVCKTTHSDRGLVVRPYKSHYD
jgi:hypothetical protein